MSYGVKILYEIDKDKYSDISTGYNLFNRDLASYYDLDYDKINVYTPGFHSISDITHDNESFYLWQITHQLNITRNLLKNRPWKQTQVMSKELDYQEALVISFIMYLGFLASNGFDGSSLFELFYRKQQLNLWRINSNY
jgi:hypothetical protein